MTVEASLDVITISKEVESTVVSEKNNEESSTNIEKYSVDVGTMDE